MSVGEFVIKHNRHCVVLVSETILQEPALFLRDFHAGPAVPLKLGGLGEATETRHETTGGHLEVVMAVIGAIDGDR